MLHYVFSWFYLLFSGYNVIHNLCVNLAGNSRWVNSMEWSGKKDFGSSAEKPFMVDGKEAGVLKSYGPLSFLKVSSGIRKLKWVLPYQQSFWNKQSALQYRHIFVYSQIFSIQDRKGTFVEIIDIN
jgi:hypothetical protein